MKINPFQGMIEQSQMTNKQLLTMNSNISNLASEIKNAFKSSSIQQTNKELEKTQVPINNIQQGLENIRKQLISVGDVDTAKHIKEYEYELLNTKEVNQTLNQQIRETKNLIAEAYNTEEVENFKNALNFEDKTYRLTKTLKEVEQELRDCGETAKANAIKQFLQETEAETINVDEKINELKTDIENCFGTEAVKQFNSILKETENTLNNTSSSSSFDFGKSLRTALGIGTLAVVLRKGINLFKEANEEAMNYAETVNLFDVSLGKTTDEYGNLDEESSKYYTKAIAFQEELSEKLGINIAESMKYQALFNTMSKSIGIGAENAYLLSENLTKFGYDLSSLFNTDTEDAMSALQSGIIGGQTKTLRADYGIDLTENTLKVDLELLGIDKNIDDMSQAEKTILRYISAVRQAQSAQGDFANTIDSTANQMKIFEAQITEMKRNIASLWQNFLGGILPYINAIIMVINELLKMVAKLFGYEISGTAVSSGITDLTDDLDEATDSVKTLKNQLMGFDEINNITVNTSSSSSSGTSVGGIDERLLNALEEYDNLMDSISNKATEIRDKILEWLGVTDGSYENLNKIWEIVKTIGVALTTWKVSSAITSLFENLGILNETQAFQLAFGITLLATGVYAQYNGTKRLLDGDVDIFSLLETFLGTAAGTWGIVNILKSTGLAKKFDWSLGQEIEIGLGVMLAIQAVQVMADGISEGDIAKQAIGALEAGLSGFSIAAATGGWKLGLKVGLTVTIIAVAVEIGANLVKSVTDELDNAFKELADLEYKGLDEIVERNNALNISEYVSNLQATRQAIQDNVNGMLAEIGYTENLITELGDLVDVNGEVIDGYEGRVKVILTQLNNTYGTEYELTGKQITKNGELVKSYQDIKDSVYKLIEAKKAEILLEANEEAYTNALKERMTLFKKYQQAQEDLQDFIVASYENGTNTQSEYYKKQLEQLEENLELSKKAYEGTLDDIALYEELQTAIIEGDSKKIEEAISNMTNVYEVEGEKISASLADRIIDAQNYKERAVELFEEQGKEINEQTRISLDAGIKTVAEKLVEQTNTIEDLTDDQIEAWKALAEGSEEIYNEKISEVSPDTQLVLQAILGTVDINSSEYINKWATMANESSTKFSSALSKLPSDTQSEILASIAKVNGYQSSSISAWASLANSSESAYKKALDSLDTDTRKEIKSAVKEIKNQQSSVKTASESVASSITAGLTSTNTGSIGKNIVLGIATGIKNNSNSSSLSSAISSVVSTITGKFNFLLGIHSPSKVMANLAQYIPEGVAVGIEDNTYQAVKSAKDMAESVTNAVADNTDINLFKELNDGIKINPQDFSIDTNQFIDYGKISGAIQAQSNISINSDISQRVYEAIIEGMKNSKIQVQVKAQADKDRIFKIIQTGAEEFAMQTGENPFPVLV